MTLINNLSLKCLLSCWLMLFARPPLSKDDLLRICCWCGQRRLMVVVSWRFSEIWRAHSFSRWWRSFPHFHKPGHLINLFGWGLHPGYKVVLDRVWLGGADNNMVEYKILTNPSPILLKKQLCPWWCLGTSKISVRTNSWLKGSILTLLDLPPPCANAYTRKKSMGGNSDNFCIFLNVC